MILLSLLLGCDESVVTVRTAGSTDTGDSGSPDTGDSASTDSGEPAADTVVVGHTREMRGLYVATVYNIDWPSSASASAATQEAEIVTLLDLAEEAGLNAVFVQMRPEGDALYASTIEPWSRWLTGDQGEDPGWDPLAVWIAEGHARGIEVHAWLNPYRAKAGSESVSDLAAGHMAHDFPEYAYPYGGDVWMDPAADVVRGRVVDVIVDLVDRYDLDGIHFDDYFYPYPDDGDFPDDATWSAYQAGGGTLARDDWRRENTAALVRDVAAAVAQHDPHVRFGIAPFGIWRPGYPSGITGMDAYADLYADPLDWVQNGWLDYLAPQLYWETGNSGQEYEPLVEWWSEEIPDDTWLFPANALYQLGTSSTWTLDEFAAQVAISRDPAYDRARGNLWYNASVILDDVDGVRDAFATRYYPDRVLPPAVNGAAAEPAPNVSVSGTTVTWTATDRRAITVYAAEGDGWALAEIVPADVGALTLGSGRWSLASVSRADVESEGIVVEIP